MIVNIRGHCKCLCLASVLLGPASSGSLSPESHLSVSSAELRLFAKTLTHNSDSNQDFPSDVNSPCPRETMLLDGLPARFDPSDASQVIKSVEPEGVYKVLRLAQNSPGMRKNKVVEDLLRKYNFPTLSSEIRDVDPADQRCADSLFAYKQFYPDITKLATGFYTGFTHRALLRLSVAAIRLLRKLHSIGLVYSGKPSIISALSAPGWRRPSDVHLYHKGELALFVDPLTLVPCRNCRSPREDMIDLASGFLAISPPETFDLFTQFHTAMLASSELPDYDHWLNKLGSEAHDNEVNLNNNIDVYDVPVGSMKLSDLFEFSVERFLLISAAAVEALRSIHSLQGRYSRDNILDDLWVSPSGSIHVHRERFSGEPDKVSRASDIAKLAFSLFFFGSSSIYRVSLFDRDRVLTDFRDAAIQLDPNERPDYEYWIDRFRSLAHANIAQYDSLFNTIDDAIVAIFHQESDFSNDERPYLDTSHLGGAFLDSIALLDSASPYSFQTIRSAIPLEPTDKEHLCYGLDEAICLLEVAGIFTERLRLPGKSDDIEVKMYAFTGMGTRVANFVTDLIGLSPASGLVGGAKKLTLYPTPFHHHKGSIAAKLTVGGGDETICKGGGFRYFDILESIVHEVEKQSWRVHGAIGLYRPDGPSLELRAAEVVWDTGAFFFYVPVQTFHEFADVMTALGHPLNMTPSPSGHYVVTTPIRDLSILPSFHIKIGDVSNSYSLTITPNEYLGNVVDSGEGMYATLFSPVNDDYTLIGARFIYQFITVFDAENSKLGICRI